MKIYLLSKQIINKGMENYYSDSRVIQALKSSEDDGLMDILTFVKDIDFEIKDNLGFDVLWDSLNGRHRTNIGPDFFRIKMKL
jgi:hypothetical protein